MKLYHVEKQKDYNALMFELYEKGYCWTTYEDVFDINEWPTYKSETVVHANDDKKELTYAYRDFYISRYPNEEIITYKAKREGRTMTVWLKIFKIFGS